MFHQQGVPSCVGDRNIVVHFSRVHPWNCDDWRFQVFLRQLDIQRDGLSIVVEKTSWIWENMKNAFSQALWSPKTLILFMFKKCGGVEQYIGRILISCNDQTMRREQILKHESCTFPRTQRIYCLLMSKLTRLMTDDLLRRAATGAFMQAISTYFSQNQKMQQIRYKGLVIIDYW